MRLLFLSLLITLLSLPLPSIGQKLSPDTYTLNDLLSFIDLDEESRSRVLTKYNWKKESEDSFSGNYVVLYEKSSGVKDLPYGLNFTVQERGGKWLSSTLTPSTYQLLLKKLRSMGIEKEPQYGDKQITYRFTGQRFYIMLDRHLEKGSGWKHAITITTLDYIW